MIMEGATLMDMDTGIRTIESSCFRHSPDLLDHRTLRLQATFGGFILFMSNYSPAGLSLDSPIKPTRTAPEPQYGSPPASCQVSRHDGADSEPGR